MPFPTPACDDSYTEHTAMAVNGPFLRQHIAPPHHDVIIDGDELRMTIGNIIQDEGADFFQRWRFEHREILSLASDLIKRPPEAFDMFDFNRHNLHGHCSWPFPGGFSLLLSRSAYPVRPAADIGAKTAPNPCHRDSSCDGRVGSCIENRILGMPAGRDLA